MRSSEIVQSKTDEVYDLGTWIGRKQTLAALAGRCAAADAECLRQVRNRKSYRALKMTWEQFCKQRIGISRAGADRIIQRLEEFGPNYFVLAQATGITPEQYRRIHPAVRDNALLLAGEAIPIEVENAPRLAAAVEELQRKPEAAPADATGAATNPETEQLFERAARGAKAALANFELLLELKLQGPGKTRLASCIGNLVYQLRRLEEAAWR